jgi:hypothetical protein
MIKDALGSIAAYMLFGMTASLIAYSRKIKEFELVLASDKSKLAAYKKYQQKQKTLAIISCVTSLPIAVFWVYFDKSLVFADKVATFVIISLLMQTVVYFLMPTDVELILDNNEQISSWYYTKRAKNKGYAIGGLMGVVLYTLLATIYRLINKAD